MQDIDKTTRSLSSFDSVEDVLKWLYRHGCLTDDIQSHIENIWKANQYRLAHPEQFSKHIIYYKLRIHIKKNGTRFVEAKKIVIAKETDVHPDSTNDVAGV